MAGFTLPGLSRAVMLRLSMLCVLASVKKGHPARVWLEFSAPPKCGSVERGVIPRVLGPCEFAIDFLNGVLISTLVLNRPRGCPYKHPFEPPQADLAV